LTLVTVYRIGTARARTLESLPYGSTLASGRWHLTPPEGLPVVYAGSSRSLCQLEKRVHCNGVAPVGQLLLKLVCPKGAPLQALDSFAELPQDWIDQPTVTRDIGTRWRRAGKALGLWVPSAVEPTEMNLLINPAHPAYASIRLEVALDPFVFDPRMFD